MSRIDRVKHGFTAIEMVAVLALAALVTGISVLSLNGPRATSQMDSVIDRIGYCDALVRNAARRRHTALRLVIDPQIGQIEETDGPPKADQTVPPRVIYDLPGGWRLDRVLSAHDENFGALEVLISPSGLSSSYAVHVTGERLGRWVVVLGLTGQVKQVSDEREAMELLNGTPQGNDLG